MHYLLHGYTLFKTITDLILVRSFESVSVSVTMAVTVFMNLLIAAALVQALYPIQLDVVQLKLLQTLIMNTDKHEHKI